MSDVPRTLEEYERSLPIPREGEVPALDERQIAEITRIVFVPSAPEPADVLFVFGTAQADWDGLAGLVRDEFAPRVVLSGQIGKLFYETGKPIAHVMRDELVAREVPTERIDIQDRSTNTLEDVSFSLPLLQGAGRILWAAKAHHSGRCARTLRRFFPSIPLPAFIFAGLYGGAPVTAENWWTTEVGRARVWGEYVRIRTYSERGDIAPEA